MNPTRPSPQSIAVLFTALVLAPMLGGLSLSPPALAGELSVSWPAAGPDAETGYRIYVGDRTGDYSRVIDVGVGQGRSASITELQDDRIHYFSIKAHDGKGSESPSFSPELACYAAPRIDAIEPGVIEPGHSSTVTLLGANFDSEVQVRSRDARVVVRSVVPAGSGRLLVRLEAVATSLDRVAIPLEGSGAIALTGSAFSLINPCRKSEEFFLRRPEAIDIDGSGSVDAHDLQLMQAAFGARRDETGYRTPADLDGDGMIDGRDLSRLMARLDTDGVSSSSPGL